MKNPVIKHGGTFLVLLVVFTLLLNQVDLADPALWAFPLALLLTLTRWFVFDRQQFTPKATGKDFRLRGLLRCGQCTSGGNDPQPKVVYSNRADAARAAGHYHRKFGRTRQEPYEADCGRWHLTTPS